MNQASAKPGYASMNPRPFDVRRDGFFINGKRDLEIQVDPCMSDSEIAEANQLTNDRFQHNVLATMCEFAPLDAARYQSAVDVFLETVIKSACTTSA